MADREKILLIRMLGLGDVACIGIPALRHWQKRYPDADFYFMTYDQGAEVIALAEPKVQLLGLERGQWPDEFLQAMEVFLGLADIIDQQGFDHVVNLDTGFMPCFMARFLRDGGHSLEGNWLAMSVQELLTQFQQQTLSAEFVNNPANFMQSSYLGMSRWHYPWWQSEPTSDHGFPEYYLRQCCGFGDIDMDWHIDTAPHDKLLHDAKGKKIVALATGNANSELSYPHTKELANLLRQSGYHVWTVEDNSATMRTLLAKLKATDLLICVPSAAQWLGATVDCPSLVLSGEVDPRTLMPDYATEMSAEPEAPATLVESVASIFAEHE